MPTSGRLALVLTLGLLGAASPVLLTQLGSPGQSGPAAADRANQTPGVPPPGAVPQPPAPAITFVDTSSTALVVTRSTLSAALLVSSTRPAGETPNVEVHALLRSSKWKPVTGPSVVRTTVAPGTSVLSFSTPVYADRTDYPLSGVIVIRELGKESKPSMLTVSGIALEDSGTADWQIARSAGIAASIGVMLATAVLVMRIKEKALATRMGAAGSSLADGWSAALIIAGPFLTTAFNLAGVPDYPATMTKKMYLIVSFVISVIIGIAPNIYGLYRAPTRVTDPQGKPAIQNQGVSGLFILSTWFTLTGCLAQIALLQLFFRDLATAGLLSAPAGRAIDWLFWALWIAVAVYGPVAIHNTITSQYELQKQREIPPAPPPLRE